MNEIWLISMNLSQKGKRIQKRKHILNSEQEKEPRMNPPIQATAKNNLIWKTIPFVPSTIRREQKRFIAMANNSIS